MARYLTADAVRELIRRQCSKRGSQIVFANRIGVSQAYLNDVVHGRRTPADAVCKALGLERIVVYRKVRK
jgi:DNA-binding transcriptional regulator YdaS (Cro superfamily)